MSLPRSRPHLASLRPYRAAPAHGARFQLSANEACLGPSPAAKVAAANALGSVDRYPDGSAAALRHAIASRHGLDAERIIVGAGSEELISLIVQAYASPGEEVLFSQYGFIKYELAARSHGAEPVRAPERDFVADVDALLAAVTDRTRVVFLANPNNPTGTYLPDAEVARLRAGLREDVVLVVDAAYAEYVDRPDYADGCALASQTRNTIALRTFSKIHGLAGLRCGWGCADTRLIEALHKVRGAFNVSSVAQAAACAAIADGDHLERARAHNTRWKAWLLDRLSSAGLQVVPSVANFLMVRFASAAACATATRALEERGVLALPLAGYGLADALRITVGNAEANRAVADALAPLAAPSRLDARLVSELLALLPNWKFGPDRGGQITREFRFDDFADAFAFMTKVAAVAEQRNHHPEWSNVYDRVTVTLTTHDADGLSMNDIEMAGLMDLAFMGGTQTQRTEQDKEH